jgi:hypothetical protein
MLWRNLERPTLVQVKKPNSQTKETNGTKQSAGDAENRLGEAQLFSAKYKQEGFHNR